MATATKETAGLFSLIRSLLTTQKKSRPRSAKLRVIPQPKGVASDDRRIGNRRTYSCWQLLAWYDGRRNPQQSDFQLVQCHDLSPKGFSFFADQLPRNKRLIICLGGAPFTFFEAEVVRSESAKRERVNGYLLGCRFVRQL